MRADLERGPWLDPECRLREPRHTMASGLAATHPGSSTKASSGFLFGLRLVTPKRNLCISGVGGPRRPVLPGHGVGGEVAAGLAHALGVIPVSAISTGAHDGSGACSVPARSRHPSATPTYWHAWREAVLLYITGAGTQLGHKFLRARARAARHTEGGGVRMSHVEVTSGTPSPTIPLP